MSFYTKIKIVLALALSLIVSFFTYTYLKNLKDDTTVVIATQDINPHTIIKSDMIKEVSISKKDKELFEKDSVTSKKELENAISKVKISKGKAITKNDDVIAGTKEELIEKKAMLDNGEVNNSYFVSGNKRVTTVSLDLEGSVDNKLNTGDFVDVIFTHTGDEKNGFSTTLMQHIEIYDIQNGGTSGTGGASDNISLLVTPDQAVDLAYAKRNGKIDLVLDSSKGDSETFHTSNLDKIIKNYALSIGINSRNEDSNDLKESKDRLKSNNSDDTDNLDENDGKTKVDMGKSTSDTDVSRVDTSTTGGNSNRVDLNKSKTDDDINKSDNVDISKEDDNTKVDSDQSDDDSSSNQDIAPPNAVVQPPKVSNDTSNFNNNQKINNSTLKEDTGSSNNVNKNK